MCAKIVQRGRGEKEAAQGSTFSAGHEPPQDGSFGEGFEPNQSRAFGVGHERTQDSAFGDGASAPKPTPGIGEEGARSSRVRAR